MSEGVSGNISSGTGGPGYQPPGGTPATAPRSGRPKWLLPVIGVLVLCCLAGAALMCLAPSVLTGAGGPLILSGLCQTENPGMDPNTCSTWANDVIAENPDLLNQCMQSSGQDTAAVYQCILDSGVTPP